MSNYSRFTRCAVTRRLVPASILRIRNNGSRTKQPAWAFCFNRYRFEIVESCSYGGELRSNENTGAIPFAFGHSPRIDDSLVQRYLPSWLPRLVGLVDELWHQGQRERGAGLSCVLSSRRDGFVLPIVLLHHHLLEHTGHLTFHFMAAKRSRAIFRDEELKTSCCKIYVSLDYKIHVKSSIYRISHEALKLCKNCYYEKCLNIKLPFHDYPISLPVIKKKKH